MHRAHEHLMNQTHRPRVISIAAEWGKTFLIQSVIGVLLAALWVMLGLQ